MGKRRKKKSKRRAATAFERRIKGICRRLGVDSMRYVEIESKKRVLPEESEDLRRYLLKAKNVTHLKGSFFFDQYLDTPRLDLLRKGASLRLRYKKNATSVRLQYKGPGFHRDGVLFRSEFATPRLRKLLFEESHHDIIHFSDTSIQDIMSDLADTPIARAMRRHLGPRIVSRITHAPIISMYQKDKFSVDLGAAFLEPSLDRVYAFHVSPQGGLHPLSTFCEYENEVKAPRGYQEAKLAHLDDLLAFDARLSRSFDLNAEKLDKYHRCASTFLPRRR